MTLVRKRWNFSMSQSEALHSLLESALINLPSSALVLPDGTVLYVGPASPADIQTLPQAASLCHRYLKLADGDMALLNDPSSGGTTLADFTFVAGVNLESGTSEAELLLVHRISTFERFSEKKKLDEEGVRVPPMPLVNRGQLNREIVSAMGAHPLAPRDLVARVEEAVTKIQDAIRGLKSLSRDPGSELRKAHFKRYFADCGKAFEQLMTRLPLGNSNVTTKLPGGETLKLQLRLSEDRVVFDFAGSDPSVTYALTDAATFGACVAATCAVFNQQVPLNAGVFEHIQVSTPSKSLLSGQPNVGTARGMHTGIAVVTDLVLQAFSKLSTSLRMGTDPGSPAFVSVQFDDGQYFTARVAPGSGAWAESQGLDAHARWARTSLEGATNLEPESLERDFPITVLGHGVRAGSGGAGTKSGGNGSMFSFQLKAGASVRWYLGSMSHKQEGFGGGRSGVPALVEVQRKSTGEREKHESIEGSARLEPGDTLTILSAGGGGYGKPVEAETAAE